MNQYSEYPQMFRPAPPELAPLLMVRVPEEQQVLSREDYYELLGQRIEWMIQQWLQVETLNQTHSRMETALRHLCFHQQAPRFTGEADWAWTAEWAATFLEYNDVLRQQLEQEFPVERRMMNLDREDQWRLTHDAITLEDWLAELTWGMVTSEL